MAALLQAAGPRYQDVVRLGGGSFAEVYRAFDPRLQRPIALKLLAVHRPDQVERMFREARAQAKIHHPGICEIYDVGWLGDSPFIAMQLIDGTDLGSWIPKLDLQQKLTLAEDICAVVQAAHDQGLVHRDLKPANIMVELKDDELHPFVVDFGLVWEDDSPDLTGSKDLLGTPMYMAPEQVRGRHHGTRSDIYGLGATFFELFSGTPPFGGKTTGLIFKDILEGKAPALAKQNADLPKDLVAVVTKAMAADPDARYTDAQSLAEDLARVRRGQPVTARSGHIWVDFARRHTATHPLLPGTGAVLLVGALLTALLVTSTLQWRAGLRLQYQAEYSLVAQGIENDLRSAMMSPAHDVRQDLEQLRAHRSRLQEELHRKGALAAPPIHFALGIAHLHLTEISAAESHLQKAWDLGFQGPQVASALGRLHAEEYRRKKQQLGPATTPERRRAAALLDAEHRRPAVQFLRAARRTRTAPFSTIEAHLAWVENDHEGALSSIREVRKQAPWQHEHALLEAEILEDMARLQGFSGHVQEAQDLFDAAEGLLHEIRIRAPSDPAIPLHLCRLAYHRLDVLTSDGMTVSASETSGLYQSGVEACHAVLELDPDSLETWLLLADLHTCRASALVWSDDHGSKPVLDAALSSARQAVGRAPDDPRSVLKLGRAILVQGEYWSLMQAAPDGRSHLIDEGIRTLESALQRHPQDARLWNRLGTLVEDRAHILHKLKEDPLPDLLRSCEILENAVALDPEGYPQRYNLSLSYWQLLKYAQIYPESRDRPLVDWTRRGIEHAAKAVEMRPKSAWAHYVTGSLYFQRWKQERLATPTTIISWDRAMDHFQEAIRIAPEGTQLLASVFDDLFDGADLQISSGLTPARFVDAAHRLLDARQDVSKADGRSSIELKLHLMSLLNGLVRGAPAPVSDLRQRFESHLVQGERTEDAKHGSFRVRRLLYAAMVEATQARSNDALLCDLREAVLGESPLAHWQLGPVAVLEAYAAADDPVRRRLARDRALRHLDPQGMPTVHRRELGHWLAALHRLPERGAVPFRLVDPLDNPSRCCGSVRTASLETSQALLHLR